MSKVIIIGAGVTGLALAQGLKKSDIPFTIYERNDSEYMRRNWAFSIHWAVGALKELLPPDLFAGLASTQSDPNHPDDEVLYHMPMYDAQSGELMKTLPSARSYRLRRDKVRHWLLTGIEVQWSKEIVSIDYAADGKTVRASFADGTADTGAIVIAADGAHSRVRELLIGKEASRLTQVDDFATAMCFSQHTREHALTLRSAPHHPINQVGVHPRGHVAFWSVHDADDASKPETWTFFHYISYHAPPSLGHEQFTPKDLLKYQKNLAKDFADPWKSAYSWIDEESNEQAWFTKIQDWDPSLPQHAWSNHEGRVTLAGDAAHPMSFQRGQGANNALRDAECLHKAIVAFWGKGDVGGDDNGSTRKRAEAIDAYEAEMKARGGKEVRLSAETTRAQHDWEKVKGSKIFAQGLNVE